MIASSKFRHPLLLLALVTTAGFALRIVGIDRWPLWGDEGLTLLVSQWSFAHLFFVPVDPTPGLYYALHKAFLGPTVGTAGARSISLACGTLLIPAAYWLAKEARVPALLSAALVALSFPLIDYSQEARAYALLVLLVTCSAASFVRWTRSLQQGQLLLSLLFGILALYTHLSSIFWLLPMCAAILWFGRTKAILPLLLFAILAVPEARRLLSYHGTFSWLAEATPMEAADTISRALLPFRPASALAGAAALVIGWRLWVHGMELAGWARSNPGAAFALIALAGSPLLVWAFGLGGKPIFMTRTILIGAPGFMLLLALLLRFEQRFSRFGVIALYAGSLLATGTTRQKDDWREIADRVGSDPVLLCQLWQAPAMRHALQRDNRILLSSDRGLIELWGDPWAQSYFEIISLKSKLPEAVSRGAAADLDAYPVWPVRSGQIEQMAARPVTLRQAIAYCDSVRIKDREPRYIAE